MVGEGSNSPGYTPIPQPFKHTALFSYAQMYVDARKFQEETPLILPEKVLISNQVHNIFPNGIPYHSVTFDDILQCANYFPI